MGRRPKADKIRRVQLKLSEELFMSIQAFAEQHGLNITQVLEMGACLLIRRGKPVPAKKRGKA